MDTILVKDLFYLKKTELSDFVNKKNVVYICRNTINGKVYVGETNDSLYNRWSGKSKFSHKYGYENNTENRVLYNAFRKYGVENFEVSIIEEGFTCKQERKKSEEKWVEYFHSYINDPKNMGYNMTRGGDDASQLKTKEAVQKRMESDRKNHGGILAYNTKESHNKSIQSNKNNHDGILACSLPQNRRKALDTNKKNHGGILAFHTEKSREKAKNTQFEKYGKLAMHLPENQQKAIEQNKKNHGGVLAMNLPENIEKMKKEAPKWRMINNIQRHIDFLKEKNLEINAENYIFAVWDTKRMWQQHIPNVLNKIEELRQLEGWTENMETIFSKIGFDNTKKGIQKILILK